MAVRDRRARLLAAAASILLGAGGCVVSCEADTVPDALTCTNAPSEASLEEVALATGPRDPAVPLEDGDPTYAVVGTQGSLMISLRALWRGPEAPACGAARFRVRHPETGAELHGESLDLLSSPGERFRVSGEVFFVVEDWPAMVDVELEVYGVSVTRRLVVGGYVADAGAEPPPDAAADGGEGADASTPDASATDGG